MAFAGQQARGRIETDPAGAGQIYLAPGVQVGEVGGRAGRAVERFHVGDELDQVAGHEAGSDAQMTQQLHHQPSRITAGAREFGQGFFRGLYTRFKPDQVADVALQALIDGNQVVDRLLLGTWKSREVLGEGRRQRAFLQIQAELGSLLVVVAERVMLVAGFEEEIEGVQRVTRWDSEDEALI